MEECDDANQVEDDICANDCTSNGIYYFADVTSGVVDNQHCTDWDAFRASLQGYDFTRIAMWGSDDMTGKSCQGQAADDLCKALLNEQQLMDVNCDGNVWGVRLNCGSSVALSSDGNDCSCNSTYEIRPCSPSHDIRGAINGDSCNTPTQTWEVVCQ
jgi:hypothetical protein